MASLLVVDLCPPSPTGNIYLPSCSICRFHLAPMHPPELASLHTSKPPHRRPHHQTVVPVLIPHAARFFIIVLIFPQCVWPSARQASCERSCTPRAFCTRRCRRWKERLALCVVDDKQGGDKKKRRKGKGEGTQKVVLCARKRLFMLRAWQGIRWDMINLILGKGAGRCWRWEPAPR